MIETLFQKIPKMLFEPLFALAVLGWLAALAASWNKRSALYWMTALSLLFMLAWRAVIGIISARYAAILIYPAVVGAAYFCFALEDAARRVPKLPAKFRHAIPFLALAVLTLVCFGKIVHYNPYEDHIRSSCALVKHDGAAFKKALIVSPREDRRYRYYSGLETVTLRRLGVPKGKSGAAAVRYLLQRYAGPADALYFFFDEPAAQEPLTPAALEQPPEQWSLLAQKYHNRKKKQQLRVYRWLRNPAADCGPRAARPRNRGKYVEFF